MIRTLVGVTLIALLSCGARGQSTEITSFEVASVKAAVPDAPRGRNSVMGDRVVFNNTTLLNVLAKAFDVKVRNQIVGPSWIFTDRYDIAAKAPDNTPKDQIPRMLQALLINRFKLVLHHETRELRAYALIIGKGRLKLVEDNSGDKNSMVVNNGRREARSMSIAVLAQMASQTLGLAVLDLTGLKGYYDFPYDFSLEETGGMNTPPVTPGLAAANSAPSIFTIMENLGLKLESRKAPFDVIVIDAGDKVPTEN
jgi:uncharacterized protein (TIGR03435 family)